MMSHQHVLELIDTHCHIHASNYQLDAEKVYQRALQTGVTKLITVGTDIDDSKQALQWAKQHHNVWASIGVHPHEAKHGIEGLELLAKDTNTGPKLVAIGEIGLDYHYQHSSRDQQIKALEQQIQLALDCNLPIIFHIREAYNDFWPIFSNSSSTKRIRGVLHSFSDTQPTLERALAENLLVGINGISTFTRDDVQKKMFAAVPLDQMILETDTPYLTPAPHRGKVNEPAYVSVVAEHVALTNSTPVETVALRTTHNATHLFHI